MLINVKMPTVVGWYFNIFELDKYNVLELEGKKSHTFSAFEFLLAVEFSCSIELKMKKKV